MKCLGKYDHNYINLIMQLSGLNNSKKKKKKTVLSKC